MEKLAEETRTCSKCGETKTLDHFEWRSDNKCYRRQCYKCHKGYERTRRQIREARLTLLNQGLKECNKCKKIKPVSEFGVDNNNKLTFLTSGCKSCRLEYQRQNPHHGKNFSIRKKYGITIQQFLSMLQQQDNKCPICKSEISGKNAHTDHCHRTGKVRAILCSKCNQGLGMFKDNPELMQSAKDYLIFHSK